MVQLFSPWYWLNLTFTERDQSLDFGLLDSGGLSVCTGAMRHNQYILQDGDTRNLFSYYTAYDVKNSFL